MVNSVGFWCWTYLPTYLTQYGRERQVTPSWLPISRCWRTSSSCLRLVRSLTSSTTPHDARCMLDLHPSERAWLDAQHRFAADHHRCRADAVHHPFDQRLSNIARYQPTLPRFVTSAPHSGSNIAYVLFGGTRSMMATALTGLHGQRHGPGLLRWASASLPVSSSFTAHDHNGIEPTTSSS